MADVPNDPIELSKSISGLEYPATKDAVVKQAESNGAGKDFIDRLKQIPDREYDGPNGIQKEFFD